LWDKKETDEQRKRKPEKVRKTSTKVVKTPSVYISASLTMPDRETNGVGEETYQGDVVNERGLNMQVEGVMVSNEEGQTSICVIKKKKTNKERESQKRGDKWRGFFSVRPAPNLDCAARNVTLMGTFPSAPLLIWIALRATSR
jgi:hypothetical protein